MPSCCVMNCLHNSHGSLRLFRFPKDEERRKSWAVNCGRTDWFPTDYSRICEAHFDDTQFEQNRQDGKKLLKWNAVPTLFTYSSECSNTTIKRRFRKGKSVEESILLEFNNSGEDGMYVSHSTRVMLEEDEKTMVNGKSEIKPAICVKLEEVDEIALIEAEIKKMECEISLQNSRTDVIGDATKINCTIVPSVGRKISPSGRKATVKRSPPKRRKVEEKSLSGPSNEISKTVDGRRRKRVKREKSTENKCPPKEEENLEDELAQIKAEIKKLMHEANVEDGSVFEVKASTGGEVHTKSSVTGTCKTSNTPPRNGSVKKRFLKRKKDKRISRGSPLSSVHAKGVTVNGKSKTQDVTRKSTFSSRRSESLHLEVGIQTDDLKELEDIPVLKAEIKQLRHKLAEKDKRIIHLEQRLAAILQPGQVVLLQKYGSNLSGAKKFVVLGKQTNEAATQKVS